MRTRGSVVTLTRCGGLHSHLLFIRVALHRVVGAYMASFVATAVIASRSLCCLQPPKPRVPWPVGLLRPEPERQWFVVLVAMGWTADEDRLRELCLLLVRNDVLHWSQLQHVACLDELAGCVSLVAWAARSRLHCLRLNDAFAEEELVGLRTLLRNGKKRPRSGLHGFFSPLGCALLRLRAGLLAHPGRLSATCAPGWLDHAPVSVATTWMPMAQVRAKPWRHWA